jgi:RNA polymerase sigma factor (sigma-70 family)
MAGHNDHAIHALFLAFAGELSAYVRRRWPNEPFTGDIVQEAFLRLLEYPQPETIKEPRAFLLRTAKNVAVDYYRRGKTRDRHIDYDTELDSLGDASPQPDRNCENTEELELFSAWLEELPELQRHAFVLSRIEGISHKEIAHRLGISVSTSERYVQITLQLVAKRFGERRQK